MILKRRFLLQIQKIKLRNFERWRQKCNVLKIYLDHSVLVHLSFWWPQCVLQRDKKRWIQKKLVRKMVFGDVILQYIKLSSCVNLKCCH